MELSLDQALQVACDGARNSGKVLREKLYTAEVHEKGPKDLVTDADIASQKILQELFAATFPTHRFLGEESPADEQVLEASDRWTWIVDPLDGTANYVHRLPNFAVSIGLVRSGIVYVGVVYDPMADELFTAIRGQGAKLNGKSIRNSGCQEIGEAMVAASFPPAVNRHSPEVGQFLNVLELSQSVRRLGSAALNLCYVGEGRLDAYWANHLKPWDVAGGLLVAAEGGAIATRHSGQPADVWQGDVLVAASNRLHEEMRTAIGIG